MRANLFVGISNSRKKLIGSRLIQWAENFEGSHVYFKLPLDYGRIYIHSNSHRVNVLGQEEFLKHHRPLYEKGYLITDEQFKLFLTHVYPLLGKNYGYLPVVGILAKRLFGLRRNPFADGNETIHCTEFADKVLKGIGLERKYDSEGNGVKEFYESIQGWEKL